MNSRALLATVALAGLAATSYVGVRGVGPIPPLGNLLDPVHGAWAASRFAEFPHDATVEIPGVGAGVDVRYDRRGVPHIFAGSVDDAIRALGYVVARDRLFQLDLQTHASAGRLTEWAGKPALPLDQQTRHLGLPRAAERYFASLDTAGSARRLLNAYADGVNAHIDELTPAEWPVEYRLLGQRPSRWFPINSLYLLSRMSLTLTYSYDERARLDVQAKVGKAAALALFPKDAPIQEPIQPVARSAPQYDFVRLPPPGAPDSTANLLAALLPPSPPETGEERPSFASNNWAVAPQRTVNRAPILAGDPHLELTLPSIWYEAHLVVPGVLDAYGVTIPGVPGIVIGFTRDLAWSFTNTGADVLDFFAETFDDPRHPTQYRLDDAWKPLDVRAETYLGKHGEVVAVDTVRYTHRGPVESWGGKPVSMRWTALEPQNEAAAFIGAVGSRTAKDFLDRMAANYTVPAQNMIVADRSGSIAIRSTGRYPIRADSGDGLVIRDGAHSSSDWQGYWPVGDYPQSFNPAQGYLASANQQPIDPRDHPRYLGYDRAYEAWRALQINRLLRADSAITVQKMIGFQTDPGSVRADNFVPFFVNAASRRVGGSQSPKLDSARALLASWDRRYTLDQEAAALFELAMRQLGRATWDELADTSGRPVATPSTNVLLELLQDSSSAWWDQRATRDRVEQRDDILVASLTSAWDTLSAKYGPLAAGHWKWRERGAASVHHLLRLPGFSEEHIPIQGGPGTLNPASGAGFGPSWRMVVELGSTVQAFGTYPGGQSGNPASARYIDRLPLWQRGTLDTLFVPASASELPAANSRFVLTVRPRREGTR
ncbi:MAG: penicillin acylase family protein [Gemmatimonadaceae bacterium]